MRLTTLLLIFLIACNNEEQSGSQTPNNVADTSTGLNHVWIDRLNNERYILPDSIDSRPISFYLENPKVEPIAKAFYKGQFRPTDNDSTTQLLSYVTIDDNILRPFYRWCLDFTISISDGALGEYPGIPALEYATKFPEEFFDYMGKDTSGLRYKQWVEIIAYSGLDNYEKKESEIEAEIIGKMSLKCQACDDETKNRIKKFARDITEAIKLQD